MQHEERERGREPRGLGGPVGDQRGGHHQERAAFALLADAQEQERQDLHGLAKPHVVGEAGAQAEPVQQPEPGDPCPLVGAQRGLQLRARVGLAPLGGGAQFVERLRKPVARDHAGPLLLFGRARRVAFARLGEPAGAGEQAQALGEAEPVCGDGGLDLFPVAEDLLQPLAVDLHPAAPDQREARGALQERPQLGGREPLSLERDLDLEVEQRGQAEPRRLLPADGHPDLGPRRVLRLPPVGDADQHAGRFQLGQVDEEAVRIGWRPRERVEHLARIDQLPGERALFRGPLDGPQQRQQRLLVPRAGVLLERAAEREVGWLAPSREPAGVGGEEGERALLVALVLREVEADAPDQVPGRIERAEELLRRARCLCELARDQVLELAPQRLEGGEREVLAAAHRRCGGEEQGQLLGRRGQRKTLALALEIRNPAEVGEQQARELLPIGERGGQVGGEQVGREQQQARCRTFAEGLDHLRCGAGVEREFEAGLDAEVAQGGEAEVDGAGCSGHVPS